jgi:hypothetical protein
MKPLAGLLLLLVVILVFQIYLQRATIHDQQNRLLDLQKQVAANSTPKTAPLEYQEKCSEQARKSFNEMGYKTKDLAGYENHYNAKLNKCFIMVQNTDATYSPTIWTHKSVLDAYEGKAYGEYSWHTVKNKKYWEVPPFMCKVVLLTGEDHFCKSDEEFDELTKVYMQDR